MNLVFLGIAAEMVGEAGYFRSIGGISTLFL